MAYLANGYKNYSRFYRDHDTFDYMGNRLLYNLAKCKAAEPDSQIKVWCCGCAGGEEVYTVQMLWQHDLAPYFPNVSLDMYATDVDASAIATAKEAAYTAHAVVEMPFDWLDAYFQIHEDAREHAAVSDGAGSQESEGPEAATAADEPHRSVADALQTGTEPRRSAKETKERQRPRAKGEGPVYKVLPELSARVRFATQDAEQEVPEETFDVILARYSVFLYCSQSAAWAILQRMVFKCLRVGGYLVIGGKDNLPSQWASLPLQKCTGSIGFGHGIHIYRRVQASDLPQIACLAAVQGDAADAAPPPSQCPCRPRAQCTGTCGYDTLEAYLAGRHNQQNKYAMTRRRLMFQMTDTRALYEEERATLRPEELRDFLSRMDRVAEHTRSRLHQLQLEQVRAELLELAKSRVPAMTAEGLAHFLDKMQAYEAQARERQEKLEKELCGTQKRKKLTKKKLRRFLARMTAAADRRRSRQEQPEPPPAPAPRRRVSLAQRPSPSASCFLNADSQPPEAAAAEAECDAGACDAFHPSHFACLPDAAVRCDAPHGPIPLPSPLPPPLDPTFVSDGRAAVACAPAGAVPTQPSVAAAAAFRPFVPRRGRRPPSAAVADGTGLERQPPNVALHPQGPGSGPMRPESAFAVDQATMEPRAGPLSSELGPLHSIRSLLKARPSLASGAVEAPVDSRPAQGTSLAKRWSQRSGAAMPRPGDAAPMAEFVVCGAGLG